ncbi:MAG TPA: MFS transporter [Vicinamibacteria bacterium]|nr:MFS transporter [Vicinamibacteria bacterium]
MATPTRSPQGVSGRTHAFWKSVFVPFGAGYFVSQLLRSINAVVSADLIEEFALGAWVVGLLTSAYFLSFALAQLPVGLALDRFGPRRTESVLLLFAGVGALVFSQAKTTSSLVGGRALIGLGVSACLMAAFHAFALWAPREKLHFLSGAVMAVGAAGALTATTPVEWAVRAIGWRALFQSIGGVTIACALLVWWAVPERPQGKVEPLKDLLGVVRKVFVSRVFWSVAPFSVAHQGAYLSIQSLWAGPWLRDVAGLTRAEVADHLLILALGMAVGFVALGYLAASLGRRGLSTVTVWVGAALVFETSQLAIALGWTEPAWLLWLLFGTFGAAGMLSYGILTTRFPLAMAGRVNTAVNVLVFSGAFTFQSGIGAVITWWTPPGEPYSVEGYRAALLGVLAVQLVSLAWLIATRRWRDDPAPVAARKTE